MTQHGAKCIGRAAFVDHRRLEPRRQRDCTRAGSVLCEVLEPLANCTAKTAKRTVERDATATFKPFTDLSLVQLEHQVIGSQTRNVGVGVKPAQRVIEIIGQEYRLDVALIQHHLGPLSRCHRTLGGVVNRFPIGGVDAICLEAKKFLANFDEPAVLRGIFDWPKVVHQAANQFVRRNPRLFDFVFGHPRGMCQLGVVVVAQQIGERSRRRSMRIDVGVRIDQSDRGDGLVNRLSGWMRHDSGAPAGMRKNKVD